MPCEGLTYSSLSDLQKRMNQCWSGLSLKCFLPCNATCLLAKTEFLIKTRWLLSHLPAAHSKAQEISGLNHTHRDFNHPPKHCNTWTLKPLGSCCFEEESLTWRNLICHIKEHKHLRNPPKLMKDGKYSKRIAPSENWWQLYLTLKD